MYKFFKILILLIVPSLVYARNGANILLDDALNDILHNEFRTIAEQAREAIQAGADITSGDDDGNRPLHYAVLMGNQEIVALLLEHRASILTRNYQRETPLSIASQQSYACPEIKHILTAHIRMLAHHVIAPQMTALACTNHPRLGQQTAIARQIGQLPKHIMQNINQILHGNAELHPNEYQIH